MKKQLYIDRLIVLALLLLNLVTVLIYVLKGTEIKTIILINIIGVNILLSIGLYLYYLLIIKKKKNPYDLETLSKYENQQEKLRTLKKLIADNQYETALSLIGDYAMEEYKDLVTEDKIPYALAVLIGRYRRLSKLEGVTFELIIENKILLSGEKINHVISLIGNLLDNALEEVKTYKKEKWITLTLSAPAEGKIFIMSQNSLKRTIDPDKIFKPGYSTKKIGANGKRGFGLSIIAELVSSYDGHLELNVEQGNSFTIIIHI